MNDRETRAAVAELARRLRAEPGADPDVFALEYITALRARGWRPTEARPLPDWKRPRGHGTEPTPGYLAARHALDERTGKTA